MTHDELLEICKDGFYETNGTFVARALRAVVELHRPVKDPFYEDLVCHCGVVGDTRYPCPTIQAIENELG